MPSLISLRDVTVRFPCKDGGQHTIFDGLNLDIQEGEFVSVVGQTGCGKSTLLRLILGSERPVSGEIRADGNVVKQPSKDRGYVPQKYSLFPDKIVAANVAFGLLTESLHYYSLLSPGWWRRRKSIREESLELLKRVGLSARDARKYPDQLSGGMQQRVAIAQSLIMRPKVLLMDEAFSALDPATRSDMQRLIRSIWSETGTTVVFVTHNLAEAVYLSSRVLLITRDEACDCSRIAMDMAVSDLIRKSDGYPKQSELDRIVHEIETTALGDRLDQQMAEFGG